MCRRWGAAGRPASGIRRAGPAGARGAPTGPHGQCPRGSRAGRLRTCVRLDSGRGLEATRTSRGPSWRPRSPGGCATGRASPAAPRPTAATARPGRASASPYEPAGRWTARGASGVAVRRAALPLQLQLPRRRRATRRSWSSRRAGLGLEALALTDHDGMYGVVRFAEAAAALGHPHGVRRRADAGPVRAAERRGRPGGQPPAAARPRPGGLPRRCAARSAPPSCAAREKGRPVYDLDEVVADTAGQVLVLTGCRKGAVPPGAGSAAGRDAARRGAARAGRAVRAPSTSPSSSPTTACPPTPSATTRWPRWPRDAGAARRSPPRAAHYATPDRFPLATALAAVRARRSLDEADGWLPPAGTAHLRSGAEMAARFEHRHPGAVARGGGARAGAARSI